MSIEGDTPISAPAPPPRRSANRRTAAFIFIFAVSVLSMLSGYRFVVGTLGNDWYLFQVAKHTVFALKVIGEDARMEGLGTADRVPPAQARAMIAARARGVDSASPDDIQNASTDPLTSWERFRYRVGEARAAGRNEENLGPYVTYVMNAGSRVKLKKAEDELATLSSSGGANDPAKMSAIEKAQKKAEKYREEVKQLESRPPSQRDDAFVFSFNLVSSCGAIEVMAIYLSAVLAFPTAGRKRLIGLIMGLPLMYLLNVFRITVLGIIGAWDHGGQIFEFVHHYLWQAVYIVFVVVVWMSWIEFVVRGKEAK